MYTTTLILTAIGGLNWGLVGLFDFNLVSYLFGIDTVFTNLIYIIVGFSALYVLVAHFANMGQESRQQREQREHREHASAHR